MDRASLPVYAMVTPSARRVFAAIERVIGGTASISFTSFMLRPHRAAIHLASDQIPPWSRADRDRTGRASRQPLQALEPLAHDRSGQAARLAALAREAMRPAGTCRDFTRRVAGAGWFFGGRTTTKAGATIALAAEAHDDRAARYAGAGAVNAVGTRHERRTAPDRQSAVPASVQLGQTLQLKRTGEDGKARRRSQGDAGQRANRNIGTKAAAVSRIEAAGRSRQT